MRFRLHKRGEVIKNIPLVALSLDKRGVTLTHLWSLMHGRRCRNGVLVGEHDTHTVPVCPYPTHCCRSGQTFTHTHTHYCRSGKRSSLPSTHSTCGARRSAVSRLARGAIWPPAREGRRSFRKQSHAVRNLSASGSREKKTNTTRASTCGYD